MTTIKSYTDIEQSKKLAEILPLESADGFWEFHTYWGSDGDEWEGYEDYPNAVPYLKYTRMENEWKEEKQDMPCWSLAALLDILESELDGEDGTTYQLHLYKAGTWWDISYDEVYDEAEPIEVAAGEELVDVCVEMIIELRKLNLI